jgi:hypothetical protein
MSPPPLSPGSRVLTWPEGLRADRSPTSTRSRFVRRFAQRGSVRADWLPDSPRPYVSVTAANPARSSRLPTRRWARRTHSSRRGRTARGPVPRGSSRPDRAPDGCTVRTRPSAASISPGRVDERVPGEHPAHARVVDVELHPTTDPEAKSGMSPLCYVDEHRQGIDALDVDALSGEEGHPSARAAADVGSSPPLRVSSSRRSRAVSHAITGRGYRNVYKLWTTAVRYARFVLGEAATGKATSPRLVLVGARAVDRAPRLTHPVTTEHLSASVGSRRAGSAPNRDPTLASC